MMKDNFSDQAKAYAKHRPQYPSALFEYVLSFVEEKSLAWDCGTGNGQSAKELSKYFQQVYATDISEKQIAHAEKKANILYAIEPAESTSLETSSVDLVTISQALHWFDFAKFYAEVKRVSKPAGIIAAWTYNLLQVDPEIDKLVHHYHFETLGEYWDEERKYVDDGYNTLPFPFTQVNTPDFQIVVNWKKEELEGFFNSWSAQQKFVKANNSNPIPAMMQQVRQHWPENETRQIIFPLRLKLGHVH